MKKVLVVVMTITMVFLSSCTEKAIGCGEGLVLEDGVCIIDENAPKDPDLCIDGYVLEGNQCVPEEEEPVDPVDSDCVMNIDDYNVTNYEMVWNDEFDTDGGLDPNKWEYLIGNGGSYGIPGWGNNELQYYTNDLKNVNITDGILKITATTEGYAQYGYTSGRVRTMNFGDWKYGVIEVCAKMPDTLGTWPAIWMLPTDSPYGGWPNGGEIDIMEAVGFETDTVHFNIHTKNDNWGTSRSIGSHSTISNIASEYHRYAVRWTETEITFFVDGVEQFKYTPVADSYEYWPFNSEFHLLLNIAVGGAWGGIQGVQQGEWDDSMYVDYVRVYQEQQ